MSTGASPSATFDQPKLSSTSIALRAISSARAAASRGSEAPKVARRQIIQASPA